MEIGIDTFVHTSLPVAQRDSVGDVQRIAQLLEEAELADRLGLSVFAIGEHHRPDFIASSPATLLAAVAARTKNIRLASAVTVLSSDDPVRVFQQFATVDLISNGRAEIIVGRGSFVESYPLFGYDLRHYDALFSEKLDLLLKLREQTQIHWQGQHRAPLTGQGVYPRPAQRLLPVRLGVGGTPASFARAGMLGLPLVVAVIGGDPAQFRPYIDLYRQTGTEAGFKPEQLSVGLHMIGLVGDTDQQAAEDMFPAHAEIFTRIGRERGWPPFSRAQFDAARNPQGPLLVGSVETVATKIRRANAALGGIDRVTIAMNGGNVPHHVTMRSIELMGSKLMPLVNQPTP